MEWLLGGLVKMVGEGDGVGVEEMGGERGKGVEEVKEVVESVGSVEVDEEGGVVGYGVRVVGRGDGLEVDGKEVYGWWGVERVMLGGVMGGRVEMGWGCEGRGKWIGLRVEGEGVVRVEG